MGTDRDNRTADAESLRRKRQNKEGEKKKQESMTGV